MAYPPKGKIAVLNEYNTKHLKKSAKLTQIAFALALILGFMGTFFVQLYRDNDFVKTVWQGNDVITFAIVAPLMLYAMMKARTSPFTNKRLFFVWMGCLWYMIYNYVFYVYAAAFNVFFLGYIAIIITSVLALFHGLVAIRNNLEDIISNQSMIASYKSTRWFLFGFALLLGGAWIAMASSFIFTGVVPVAITQTDHPTGVVFATDLLLLVAPLFVLSYYLKKPARWALLLTPIILVKCCLYPLVFVVAGIFAYNKTGAYDVLTPVYLLLGFGSYVTLMRLIKKIR